MIDFVLAQAVDDIRHAFTVLELHLLRFLHGLTPKLFVLLCFVLLNRCVRAHIVELDMLFRRVSVASAGATAILLPVHGVVDFHHCVFQVTVDDCALVRKATKRHLIPTSLFLLLFPLLGVRLH